MLGKFQAMRLPRAAVLLQDAVTDTLTYYQFPSSHWRRIRTIPLENSITSRLLKNPVGW